MKPLNDHNAERSQWHHQAYNNDPMKNGIACPECGKELWDSSPSVTLTSMPPQKNVHCDCGYKGYRVA